LIVAEEYEPMEFGDLMDPINWVHHKPFIFSNGLISWMSRRQAAEAIKELIEKGEEEPDDGE
uniref:Glutathione S-transferase n=1 Tax=Rodentolepis nana TaxID=102285 RepID=A0A0R3TI41_RODNA